LGSRGSAAAVATRAAQRPVLGACAYSRRLRGASVNLGVGGTHDPVSGRWQQPTLRLREVRVVMVVLFERYRLLVVAAAGLWHWGYSLDMNNGGGPRVSLAPT
jgi:hypothetical protein